MDSTSPSQETLLQADQEKVNAYASISNMIGEFLENDLEGFLDGTENTKIISKEGITITIDISKLRK